MDCLRVRGDKGRIVYNFDIYLPNWFAQHNRVIFGVLFVLRWRGRAVHCGRGEAAANSRESNRESFETFARGYQSGSRDNLRTGAMGEIRTPVKSIERSVILCSGDTFWVDPAWLSSQESPLPEFAGRLTETLQNQEKEIIEAALAESKGKVAGPTGAAVKLENQAS